MAPRGFARALCARRSGRLLPSLILLPFTTLAAQRVTTSLDLGSTTVHYADTLSATGPSMRPSMTAEWAHAVAGLSGSYSRFANASNGEGVVYGSLFSRRMGLLVGEIGAVAGGSVHQAGTRTGQAAATARLHLMRADRGAWIGGGAGQAWDGTVRRSTRVGELGGWLRLPQQTLIASATPASLGDSIEYADVQLSARHHAAKLDADLSFGVRSGDRLPSIGGGARQWGSAALTMWIRSGAALVVAAGTYPADLSQGYPGGRFATLGVRLSGSRARLGDTEARRAVSLPPEEPSFDVASRGEARTFRVRAADARSVELAGDFSGWKPVPLVRGHEGTWAATLSIPPGTYQMNVRFDGGPWTVPIGLSVVRDEFGGSAGLLVLE